MAADEGNGGPGRPWVVVNCAMSVDGKIALPGCTQVDISSPEDMVRVHRLRATCDAILVGSNTILRDDPKLHVSPGRVPDPPALLKIVLDSTGRTPKDARFMESPGPSLVATVEDAASALDDRLCPRAEVLACGSGPRVDLTRLLANLADRGVRRLMVEGGGETIWSFLGEGLVDELSVYIGPMVIGGAEAPTMADGAGARDLASIVGLELLSSERLGDGLWVRYRVLGRR